MQLTDFFGSIIWLFWFVITYKIINLSKKSHGSLSEYSKFKNSKIKKKKKAVMDVAQS